jgi:hypothetical protein
MLKVLAELKNLADQLDSKKQYKLADEVEGIMAVISSKPSAKKTAKVRKIAQETIPELQAPGDPYSYSYDAATDSFVVTSPRGKGTRIEQGGRYDSSWQKLKKRLPRDMGSGPSASGPIDRVETEAKGYEDAALIDRVETEAKGYEDTALIRADEIKIGLASGEYGEVLKDNILRNNRLNKYHTMSSDRFKGEVNRFIRDLEKVIEDPKIGPSIGRFSKLHEDISAVKHNLEIAKKLREGTSPAQGLLTANKKKDLVKEASENLAASFEVAFHNPGKTPFGR